MSESMAGKVALITGGSIVNNASIVGIVGAPAISPYIAAEHGVVGLTRNAATWRFPIEKK